ncbi:conserved hypothetical protein [Lebetimonas natsushimae]|uniref:Uncharacterized protein n=1 Tax=Lebetimonas natsushimae TaxID=1936991 RepID=A0A292Y986_9BACT|nr:hypothetical protein [Lebetimonas natsushimae]GAX87432.1 conserved hypothetical protein [Lebetimonas natsushimae]
MKKILALLSMTGLLFAARYPIIVEYNYLKGCIQNKNIENYCICTLNAIENRYTLNEFITASQDKEKAKKLIGFAVSKCLDKLKNN